MAKQGVQTLSGRCAPRKTALQICLGVPSSPTPTPHVTINRKMDFLLAPFKKVKEYYAKWKAFKANLHATNKFQYFLVDTAEAIAVAFVVVILILRPTTIQSSKIFSGSMIPTLEIGDRLFVNRLVYHFRDPQRGEIMLFYSPEKDRRQFVKRVIALPGETIEIKAGIIYINGKEMLFPGVDVQRDYSYYPQTKIPAKSYFMMGDNRGNSDDSRHWGFVLRDQVIGKAFFTFWPIDRIQILR